PGKACGLRQTDASLLNNCIRTAQPFRQSQEQEKGVLRDVPCRLALHAARKTRDLDSAPLRCLVVDAHDVRAGSLDQFQLRRSRHDVLANGDVTHEKHVRISDLILQRTRAVIISYREVRSEQSAQLIALVEARA